ncbi:hypothetical protein [Microbacterium sp. Marseille-Q6965]|uniref:hypothetical protein n=1 Tax=Microbacterium sp. Marseille-Q6965 TaxID=2965072 RepID=UPI0021B71CEA|nr:hypothetical protein [Microbacterium sp. Marseille-Q6965]
MVSSEPFDLSTVRLGDADATHAVLARIRETAAARAATARAAVSAFSRLSAEAWSPRREARVRVGATGLVEEVTFADWAPQESPLALATAVQRAHDDALRQWYAAFVETAQEQYAAAPELLRATIERTRAMLPERIVGEG